MKKQFKDVCPGNILYECVIKDSSFVQDCVGNIIVEKYVPATCSLVNSDKITIILQNMRYSIKDNGYIKEDRPDVHPKEIRISPPRNSSAYVDYVIDNPDGTYLTRVNQRIVATTKREIVEILNSIIKDNKEDIKDIETLIFNSKMKNETMELILSCSLRRLQLEPKEELEKEMTEEEFASMAL